MAFPCASSEPFALAERPRRPLSCASLMPILLKRARVQALLTLLGVLFGGWLCWSTLLLPRLPALHGWAHVLQSIGVRLLLWVVPAAVYLWRTQRPSPLAPLRLSLPRSTHEWSSALVLVALAAYFVSLDVAHKLNVAAPHVWVAALRRAPESFPVAPLFEELIFRGVIFAELLSLLGVNRHIRRDDLRARGRVWLANLAQSLVFVGLHWPWWILADGIGASFFQKSGGVFLLSLVLGMVFVRGRSLWPCILLHWMNNLLSSLTG